MGKISRLFVRLSRWSIRMSLPIFCAFAAACAPFASSAQVFTNTAVWNFDSGPQNGTAFAGTFPYNANYLDSSIFSSGSVSSMIAGANTLALVTGNSGTGTGSGNGSQGNPGFDLQYEAKTAPTGNVNGSSFLLTLTLAPTVNTLSSITINYDVFGGNVTGSGTNTWTLGGAASGTQTANILENGTWQSESVTFNGLNLVANNTITLTSALSGFASSNGYRVRFDNIDFDVMMVPEPTTSGLFVFGLIFVGWNARRILLRNRSAAKSA
jgi:hypothetical protein